MSRGKCKKCGVSDPLLVKGLCDGCRREDWPKQKTEASTSLKEQIAADMGLLTEAHSLQVKALNVIVKISKTITLLRPFAQDMESASKTQAEKAMLNLYDAVNEAEKSFVHKARYK